MKKKDVDLLRGVFGVKTAKFIIAHAAYQRSRGRGPSMSYMGERNPKKALVKAEELLLIMNGHRETHRNPSITIIRMKWLQAGRAFDCFVHMPCFEEIHIGSLATRNAQPALTGVSGYVRDCPSGKTHGNPSAHTLAG